MSKMGNSYPIGARHGIPSMRPGETPGGKDAPEADQFRMRMEMAAVDILEKVLNRQRWSITARDALADHLGKICNKEAQRVLDMAGRL